MYVSLLFDSRVEFLTTSAGALLFVKLYVIDAREDQNGEIKVSETKLHNSFDPMSVRSLDSFLKFAL